MSTRAVIARKTGEGQFTGVYHHWDGYPSALGKTLYELNRGHFHGNTAVMLNYLIDQHPAGWSTINDADFNLTPGYVGDYKSVHGPQCYCHGQRHEKGWKVNEKNAQGSGCEWAYVFDGDKMLVLSSYSADGSKMIGMFGMGDENAKWKIVATVDLKGPAEPDWDKIEDTEEVQP